MNQSEVSNLMTRIKNNYPMFPINTEQIEEWHDELMKYAKFDVFKSYEEYVKDDVKDRYPKVYDLTQKLTPTNEKHSGGTVVCHICNKNMSLFSFEKHYSRCSSVNYIARNSLKYWNKEVNKKELFDMETVEFEKRYHHFLSLLLSQNISNQERYCINKQIVHDDNEVDLNKLTQEFIKEF